MADELQRAFQLTFEDYFFGVTIDTLRLGIGTAYTMRYFLNEMDDNLREILANGQPIRTKKQLYDRIRVGNESIDAAYGVMASHLDDTLLALVAIENIIVKTPFEAVGISLGTPGLTQDQIRRLVDNTWVMGSPTEKWWSTQSATAKNNFARMVRLGYAQGLGMEEIARSVIGAFTGKKGASINPDTGRVSMVETSVGGAFSTAYRDVDGLVRTAVMSMSEAARRDNLKRSFGSVLKGYIWHSTLDLRTSEICRLRSNKKYTLEGVPIGHSLPFLGGTPAHFRCRSTLLPFLGDYADVGVTDQRMVEILDRWKGRMKQASMDGPVPAELSYEQWFALQPESRQKDIMGSRRWELWKKQQFTFDEMTDYSGRPLTIKALKEKYNIR